MVGAGSRGGSFLPLPCPWACGLILHLDLCLHTAPPASVSPGAPPPRTAEGTAPTLLQLDQIVAPSQLQRPSKATSGEGAELQGVFLGDTAQSAPARNGIIFPQGRSPASPLVVMPTLPSTPGCWEVQPGVRELAQGCRANVGQGGGGGGQGSNAPLHSHPGGSEQSWDSPGHPHHTSPCSPPRATLLTSG